jgi:hypothetical protein
MKSSIFCSLLKVNRCFGGKCRLHIQGRRISLARNQALVSTHFKLVSCLAYYSTLNMKATFSSEMSVTFNSLQGVISQKTELSSIFFLIFTSQTRIETSLCWLSLKEKEHEM